MDGSKSWEDLSAEERERAIEGWESATGNLYYIVKHLAIPEEEARTTLKVLDRIKASCKEAGTCEWEAGSLETVRETIKRKLEDRQQNNPTSVNYH